MSKKKRVINKELIKNLIIWGVILGVVFVGIFLIWATTINLPNLNSFEERRVAQSTKIYDRTGEIVLYDVFGEYKRTVISADDMSEYIKQATVAVEDQGFYEHNGIEISAIFRAIRNNIVSGNLLTGQGGSTITQQVLKNALLTTDKKISRKIKEWVLAPRLEKVLSKEEILEIYLNEVPYGGSVYGIQEAARRFFGKDAKDLSLVESAYLAALPQAPTFYSPYGNNLDSLEIRKDHVLDQMVRSGYITENEANETKQIAVEFEKPEDYGIKAPHFVIYIRELLEEEYGREAIEEDGLKVITTLNWDLQKEAEEILKERAFENLDEYDAENMALVSLDPNTGEILAMVGSRDYFDEEIDGNFNVVTAARQPGSTFKPFVYAEAFNKGYRPETVVFDLKTEFSSRCDVDPNTCYSPSNFDGRFNGPLSLRDALARSLNIPAVKTLYLAGLRDSLRLAQDMGIDTLTEGIDTYGLTLVLGGGEVTPLDMAQAYSVFATEGIKYEPNGIVRIEDREGEVIYEPKIDGERILSEQTSRLISDILSDDEAKKPTFGSISPLYFGGRVAVKTGTTNDYRDAWTIGYTPNFVTVVWAGNNDNRSMDQRTASMVASPVWREYMDIALQKIDSKQFTKPEGISGDIKPILAGYWKGEEIEVKSEEDEETQIRVSGNSGEGVHSILYWVNKDNPLGPKPSNPSRDPQFDEWEKSVKEWVRTQNIDTNNIEEEEFQNFEDSFVELNIISPQDNTVYERDEILVVSNRLSDRRNIASGKVYIDDNFLGDIETEGDSILFIPSELDYLGSKAKIRSVVQDDFGNDYVDTITIYLNY